MISLVQSMIHEGSPGVKSSPGRLQRRSPRRLQQQLHVLIACSGAIRTFLLLHEVGNGNQRL